MLGKRVDRLERLEVASTLPIGEQFVPVQPDPLAYESQRPCWKLAAEHRSIESDRRPMTRLLGIEVG